MKKLFLTVALLASGALVNAADTARLVTITSPKGYQAVSTHVPAHVGDHVQFSQPIGIDPISPISPLEPIAVR